MAFNQEEVWHPITGRETLRTLLPSPTQGPNTLRGDKLGRPTATTPWLGSTVATAQPGRVLTYALAWGEARGFF
jgi:hypothetical protein